MRRKELGHRVWSVEMLMRGQGEYENLLGHVPHSSDIAVPLRTPAMHGDIVEPPRTPAMPQ